MVEIYFWVKSHIWRIFLWINLIVTFISNYNGEYQLANAILNTLGVWGIMLIGQFSYLESLKESENA